MKYVRKIGRSFSARLQGHIRAIRSKKDNSGYTQNILNVGHTYGKIEDILQGLYRTKW
jgi:hypothetical protein